MPDDRSQPTQACFLIGPPGAPAEMKALYDQAEQQAKGGNDSLAKRLFGLRQNTIKYITLPDAKKKPMIQRILEEKLGKEIQKVEAKVDPAYLRGDLIPNLTISLKTTLYADGSPIAPDLSDEVLKALENSFGYIFKAQWIQSSVR